MKQVNTYWARIYVAHSDWHQDHVERACQEYVDKVGLCVTVTPTMYIYTGGKEKGTIVGLINYPRFPFPPQTIRRHALAIAKILKKKFKQKRVSVEFPDTTIMLGKG